MIMVSASVFVIPLISSRSAQKEILFRTAFSVKNEGVYDISDIDISAQIIKGDNTPLFSYEKQDMVVLHGTNTTFDLLIPLDLDTISFFDWFSLLYKNTTLSLLLNIDAFYMFGLVEFTANEAIKIPWSNPPLISPTIGPSRQDYKEYSPF